MTDPSGAVIPGAKITLTNASTGVPYSTVSNSTGLYVVPNLPPATYTLKVEAKGFKTYVQQGIPLVVNQAASVNTILQVGSPVQTVQVSGAPPLLETQNAHLGQSVSGNMVRELPLVGRDATRLIELAPGVAPAPGQSAGNDNGMKFDANGGRYAITDVTLDGMTESGPDFEERDIRYVPPIDAIQEFKVEENNFSVDTGFSGTTIVKMVMRSGTNQFHGEAFEFDRNNKFDANNFFSNRAGGKLPPLHWNNFGGTFGGPIQKNKTFFFFDYQGIRTSSLSQFAEGVPTQAERSGDFSALCGYKGGTFNSAGMCSAPAGQLWDPYSGTFVPGIGAARSAFIPFDNLATYQSPGNPTLAGTPFQPVATPGNLINPTSAKIMKYFPLPQGNPNSPSYNPYDNWAGSGSSPNNSNSIDLKVDRRFGASTQSSARLAYVWGNNYDALCFDNAWDPCGTGPETTTDWNGELTITHNFGPNKLLTVTYGFVRGGWINPGTSAFYPKYNAITDVGFPASIFNTGYTPMTPQIAMDEYARGTDSNIGAQQFQVSHVARQAHDILPSLDWIFGRHDFKIGGEIRISQQNTFDDGYPQGYFQFEQAGTANQSGGSFVGGDAMATFLTGTSVGGSSFTWATYERPAWTEKTWSLYAEDTWRATNKMTVNAGVRYDVQYPGTDRYNRYEYFDPTIPNPLKVPGMPNLMGGDVFASPSNRGMYPTTFYGAVQPRVGLAYRLNEKTVVRAGAGIFYDLSQYGAFAEDGTGSQDGFTASTPGILTYQNAGAVPGALINNPFPGGLVTAAGSSLGALTFVGLTPTGGVNWPGWQTVPSDYAWNLSVQRDLPGNILVEADYVGQKGTHWLFAGYTNLDHLGPSVEKLSTAQLTALDQQVANPFYGIIKTGPLSSPTISAAHLKEPFPEFNSTNIIEPPWANANYNALQLRAAKRFAHGLEFFANYTWSKSLNDTPCNGDNVCWMGLGTPRLRDPNDLALEYGLSSYNDPQIFNLAYTYALPFGQGRRWGSSWKTPVDTILGGWETTGIWTFDTGEPLPISWKSCGVNIPTYGCQHVDLVGRLQKAPGVNLQDYFANSSSAIATPAPFTLGTAGELLDIYSPGARNFDLAVYKNFSFNKLREGMHLQVRVESINAFNHPQFSYPNTTFGSPTFGLITSQENSPRQIQLGMKLIF
ncbi:MAG: TonB-dependent receptor domain-containing protein [Terriglobia bacterium]